MNRTRLYRPARVLLDHVQRHRLHMIAYEGVTEQNLNEAKELVCEAARRVADHYSQKVMFTDFAAAPLAGLLVVLSTRADKPPRSCPMCKGLSDE